MKIHSQFSFAAAQTRPQIHLYGPQSIVNTNTPQQLATPQRTEPNRPNDLQIKPNIYIQAES